MQKASGTDRASAVLSGKSGINRIAPTFPEKNLTGVSVRSSARMPGLSMVISNRTLELRMRECDTVFFLDYPLEVCLEGAASRIGKERVDIPWKEEEFDEEFRQWILDFPKDQLPEIYALLEKYWGCGTFILFGAGMRQNSIWREKEKGKWDKNGCFTVM